MSYMIGGISLGFDRRGTVVPINGTNEVQTITIGGTPTGGTFRLTFEGFTTAPIPWNAVNATLLASIDAALKALPSIGIGNVATTAGTLTAGVGTILLAFSGNLGALAIGTASVAENAMTGAAPTIGVAETTPGVNGTERGCPRGARYTNTVTGIVYVNVGTEIAPGWVAIGSQT